MLVFIVRRLLQAVPVLFLSSVVIFLLLRLVPGDPAQLLAGQDASPEVVATIRRANGLDQPLPLQYVVWLSNVVRGDLGRSFFTRAPVIELIGQRAPATVELAVAALLLSVTVALPLGIVAALRRGSRVDWAISAFASLAFAVPGFWLGILAIILFGLVLGWLPPGGRGDPLRDPVGELKFLILPAATLALASAAALVRLVRTSMLEVLNEDYVRTARAKGLRPVVVVSRHALRNALVPIITVLGLQFGRLLGGAIIIESVFSWPGLGRLVRDAIGNRDYAVVQACLLILVMLFILINLFTDIVYGLLDPRIRLSGGARR